MNKIMTLIKGYFENFKEEFKSGLIIGYNEMMNTIQKLFINK